MSMVPVNSVSLSELSSQPAVGCRPAGFSSKESSLVLLLIRILILLGQGRLITTPFNLNYFFQIQVRASVCELGDGGANTTFGT